MTVMDFFLDFWTCTCLTVGILVTAIVLDYWQHRRGVNLPPGPKGLPFIGSYLSLKSDLPAQLSAWAERYGNTICVTLGRDRLIVINDFDTAKSVLSKDNVSGRDPWDLMHIIHNRQGLLLSDGPVWREHRRFAISSLKDIGMGKSWLEQSMVEEVQDLLRWIEGSNEQPIDIRQHLTQNISNVICALVFGKRFQRGDAIFNEICNNVGKNLTFVAEIQALRHFPFLKYIPFGQLGHKLQALRNNLKVNRSFLQSLITEHENRFRDGSEYGPAEDYIHRYMEEQKSQQAAIGNKTTFTESQLYYSVVGLFGGGTESSTSTLLWALVYMIGYPEARKRVQSEISAVVDLGDIVTMEHRSAIRYTEAVLMEVLRLTPIFPLNGSKRCTVEEMQIDGYTIPAGTLLVVNSFAVQRDPKYWSEPSAFQPERFINPATNLLRTNTAYMPFGIGKRQCIGEGLAKVELLLFFANIMHKFDIDVPQPLSDPPEAFLYRSGLMRSPKPLEIIFRSRFRNQTL